MRPEVFGRRVLCALVSVLLFSVPVTGQPNGQTESAPGAITHGDTTADEQRLAAGDVVVDSAEINGIRYVVARVWIDQTPESTWRTLVNPYEFEGRIMHRMKRVDVLTDEVAQSLMTCTVGVIFPIPDFKYTVESHYTACSKVEFHRTAGSFKDFRGFWGLEPVSHGTKTEVTYSMYIDPGFPVPDWLVREAVRMELPNVLTGLRERVTYLKSNADAAEKRTLVAATAYGAPPAVAAAALQPATPSSIP
jgi:hypothetical protein